MSSTFFSREDLSLAAIIGQVDKKFIACLITSLITSQDEPRTRETTEKNLVSSGTSTLVLVDQHAADERVRVEGFLKELCLGFLYNCDKDAETPRGLRLQTLKPPKPVLVTRHELRTLEESTEVQEAFRNWGFCFTRPQLPDSTIEDPVNGTNHDDNHGLGQILVETIPDIVSDKVVQTHIIEAIYSRFPM
jgi:DNA mismatch repair protein MLH3